MSYFIAFSACMILSCLGALGLLFLKPQINIKLNQAKLYLLVFCVLFFAVYSILSCWKYDNLWFGLWDLGIFDSMIYKMSRFDGFMQDFRGAFDHFSPMAVFWVPLYWIFNSPKVLLISQSFLLAAAAIPLFYCVKSKLHSPLLSIMIAAMYLLNPLLSRFALFEFHIECLFPLVFFSAWYFYEQKKYNYFIIILLLGIFVKEDFCIVVIAAGIYLLSKKQYKLGIICFVATALVVLFILYVWFPYIVNYNYYHQNRYPPLFDSNIFTMALNACKFILHGLGSNSLAVSLVLLLAFAFLPLFAPRELVCLGLPVLFIHFCSVAPHQQLLMSHYSIEANFAFPIIAMYGIYNARRKLLPGRKALKYIYCFSCIAPVFSHIMFCELPNRRYYSFIPRYDLAKHLGIFSVPFDVSILSNTTAADFYKIIKVIPEDFTVTVQNNLGCQFLRHKAVHSLPGPNDSDAYLFHVKCFHRFDVPSTVNNKIKFLIKNKKYLLVVNHKGLLIFVKKTRLKDLKFKKIEDVDNTQM